MPLRLVAALQVEQQCPVVLRCLLVAERQVVLRCPLAAELRLELQCRVVLR